MSRQAVAAVLGRGDLACGDRLVRRGLVVVEAEASGRGRSSTLVLAFAESGPWWEGEINIELLEAVLGCVIAAQFLSCIRELQDGLFRLAF